MTNPVSWPSLLGRGAIDVAPPAAMTLYTLMVQGLPLVIWLLGLILVALRIAKFVWDWQMAIEDRKAGRLAGLPIRSKADE